MLLLLLLLALPGRPHDEHGMLPGDIHALVVHLDIVHPRVGAHVDERGRVERAHGAAREVPQVELLAVGRGGDELRVAQLGREAGERGRDGVVRGVAEGRARALVGGGVADRVREGRQAVVLGGMVGREEVGAARGEVGPAGQLLDDEALAADESPKPSQLEAREGHEERAQEDEKAHLSSMCGYGLRGRLDHHASLPSWARNAR
mgnify:CR=1 FL=1